MMLTAGTLRQKPCLLESWFCAVCEYGSSTARAWGDAMLDRVINLRRILSRQCSQDMSRELNADTMGCDAIVHLTFTTLKSRR